MPCLLGPRSCVADKQAGQGISVCRRRAMLQHLPAAGEAGDSQSLAADLAAQNEHFLYLRQLLKDIESVFGRLSSGLATLHVGVEELAREKKAMPIREKKAVPSRKTGKAQPGPRLTFSAQRLPKPTANRASGV